MSLMRPELYSTSKFKSNDFELAFEHSPIGMAIVGMDGSLLKVNPSFIETFGYSEKEIEGMTFYDLTYPEDLLLGDRAINDFREGRLNSIKFEKRYIHKNGRIIYALLSTSVVRNSNGASKYMVSQIQDISEQKRAELQARLIVESTVDGYWDWRIQEGYAYMSPRFWEMFGYEPSQKKHHLSEWADVIFEEDKEKATKNFDLHVQTKGEHPYCQESRFRHADGRTVWVLCRGSVVEWDTNGRPLRMMGTHTDITDLKMAQQALAQNSKMVALGEMAGGIAHEINNPLAVIMGYSNRLRILCDQGELDTEQVLRTCEKLEQTSLRISRIVKGLRIYSRDVENEELKEILVNDLIEDTLSFCIEKFRSHGIELNVHIHPEEASIVCRPIQISQVLLNLLNNAFDAIRDRREKWIRVEFTQDQDESRIVVVDSGPGIPESIKDKVMEPFFTTKPVGVGTGLGLSICSGIVSVHGGVLSLLDSEPHTTFCVAIPSEEYIR